MNKQHIEDVKLYLQYAKLCIEDNKQEVKNDCARRNMQSSSLYSTMQIDKFGISWQEQIREIYMKIDNIPVKSIKEAILLRDSLTSYINDEIKSDKIFTDEFKVSCDIAITRVITAITEGHNTLVAKIKSDKKNGHRTFLIIIITTMLSSLATIGITLLLRII